MEGDLENSETDAQRCGQGLRLAGIPSRRRTWKATSKTLKQMRNDVDKASDSLESRLDLLQNYCKALCVMESRFPISRKKEHVHTVTFIWCGAFKENKKAAQQNIHLEKAVFNLAAIQSQIALSADRTTANGLKQACNAFQAAAGAFALLRDNISMKASVGQSTLDVSVECAGMLERLMLAQDQECFFEKVISDGKPNYLCSKAAKQIESALSKSCKANYVLGWE